MKGQTAHAAVRRLRYPDTVTNYRTPTTAEQTRDRAHAICIRWGVDPFDASHAVWSAACEVARADLLVEALTQHDEPNGPCGESTGSVD